METGQSEKKSYTGGGAAWPLMAILAVSPVCLLCIVGALSYYFHSGRLPW